MPAMVDAEVIRNAVRLACRAPSLHNSQPWRWVLEGAALQLFADADRVVRATDSSGREALMACGAVLDHFRVAMAAAGYTANVDRFPNPNNRLHVASVDFTPMKYVTDGHRQTRERDSAATHRSASVRRSAPTGIRSNRRCATRLPPTPSASTQSPTICVRSWPKRLSSPSRCASTIRRITRNSNGGQQLSRSLKAFRTAHWYRPPRATASTSDVLSR